VRTLLAPGFRMPMLPAVASEALALAMQPDLSFGPIERLVTRDPLLTARIVAVANSPLYARGMRVSSIRAALQRLGSEVLRDVLCQAVADAHVFRNGPARQLREQREHAVVVAHACRETFAALNLQHEPAFLCGLLHDMGRAMLLPMIAKSDDALVRAAAPAILDALHTTVGARIAGLWGLPTAVLDACGYHHDFGRPGEPGYRRTANAVAAAERLSELCGAGTPRSQSAAQSSLVADVPEDPSQDPILRALNLAPDEIGALLDRIASLGERLAA
jgi:HD-like signal output (HDOD) protein